MSRDSDTLAPGRLPTDGFCEPITVARLWRIPTPFRYPDAGTDCITTFTAPQAQNTVLFKKNLPITQHIQTIIQNNNNIWYTRQAHLIFPQPVPLLKKARLRTKRPAPFPAPGSVTPPKFEASTLCPNRHIVHCTEQAKPDHLQYQLYELHHIMQEKCTPSAFRYKKTRTATTKRRCTPNRGHVTSSYSPRQVSVFHCAPRRPSITVI